MLNGMKKYLTVLAIIVLVILAVYSIRTNTVTAPWNTEACTQEAKICSDGSSVGRTGPNCAFAECPSEGPVTLGIKMGQEVSDLGVSITPLKVLEDSRCPIDVTCIQAGTVRIQARLVSGLGEARQEFKLGQPITTEAEEVTLIDVSPKPKAGMTIADGEYLFRFEIEKR